MRPPPRTPGDALATRRPLKIFASDPLLGRTFGNRAQVEIANERVTLGPVGPRVEVIDYDGTRDCFYRPLDLDSPTVLMQGGLDPTESDPAFHQQMVYAVATRTVENFDRALGHPMRLSGLWGRYAERYPRLRLFPHAFHGANAFYARELNAILFGYFTADAQDPGANLPGQTVFTCLSHDIIAHETTHALVDRLRPLFLEPTNLDVLAFHEAFSDIVALLQHFSFPDVLRQHIQQTRSDIRSAAPLMELARQFGYATGSGKALRSAIDDSNRKLGDDLCEPHDRGAILVAAVFGGFLTNYRARIGDLLRIATGGTGQLPAGDLHPDLVSRIAREASGAAQRVLDMCIRAFDYLPPVDVNFGDFLRALVTADHELVPGDPNLRDAMIESFRLRGIYPRGVTSLAEESLLWPAAPPSLPPIGHDFIDLLRDLFFDAIRSFDTTGWQRPRRPGGRRRRRAEARSASVDLAEVSDRVAVSKELSQRLWAYAQRNAAALGLAPELKPWVSGFHPVFRVAPNGQLLIELVAQFVQRDLTLRAELGGIAFSGGATLVAAADGTVRYLIQKHLDRAARGAPGRAARERLERQRAFVALADMLDPRTPYLRAGERSTRIEALASFAALHGG